jgi:phosphohistidine phosphatase
VSDARRTRETWELVQPSFPNAQAKFLRSLYHGSAGTLLVEAESTGAESVMLVGHNPGMHELASRLAYRNTPMDAKLRAKFPTAAGAIFARKDDASSWKLQSFVTPKMASD